MAEKERELNEALQMIEAQRIDEKTRKEEEEKKAKEKGENNIRNSLRPRTGTPDSYAEEMKRKVNMTLKMSSDSLTNMTRAQTPV